MMYSFHYCVILQKDNIVSVVHGLTAGSDRKTAIQYVTHWLVADKALQGFIIQACDVTQLTDADILEHYNLMQERNNAV